MTTSKELAAAAGIEVQVLAPNQWSQYKGLRLRALQSEPQAFGSCYARELAYPDELWRQRLGEHHNGRSWCFFARMPGAGLIGMISGFRNDHDLQHHSVHIFAVFVDKAMRGRGVARALIARLLEEFAADSDLSSAVLDVNTDQQSAKRLYESFGFEVVDTYMQRMGDGLEHQSSKMEKKLRR
jgi:ribosomal protein S18 acetylase RimI-like enzyme